MNSYTSRRLTGNARTRILRLEGAIFFLGVVLFASASAPELRAQGGPLRILTSAPLPTAITDRSYVFTIEGAGGEPPYVWTASGLPPGLSIGSTTGRIIGTPTSAGSFSITITLRDAAQTTVTRNFTLIVQAALAITTTSLPSGVVGSAYSATLVASGGTPPYSWSLISGSLPPGLTLSAAGAISGTPTSTGPVAFTVRALDSESQESSKDLSITIQSGALSITTSSPLPAGSVGASYSQALTASGGTLPYTWSITSGSLPAGLTLSAAGSISGSPTSLGTANFVAQVTDTRLLAVAKSFSLTINPAPLAIATTSLSGGLVGVLYSQTLAATGGLPPYAWSVSGGTLPAGLTLSSAGVISGTPTSASTANLSIRVSDSGAQTVTKSFSIIISAPLSILSASPLPAGLVGVAYSQTLSASGGTAPYTWSITAGTLPAGLNLAPSGVISGTPTAATNANLTIQVVDAGSQTLMKAFALTISSRLTISTLSLPSGVVGTNYAQAVSASGGSTPYTWSVVLGDLPPGLLLSSAGILSGTPLAAGTFKFTVRVNDSAVPPQTATQEFTLVFTDPLIITTQSIGNAPAGAPYSATFTATGGVKPYSWSVSAGTLPQGLTLSTGGTLSGTPTTAAPFTFTVRVTDANGSATSKDFSITIQTGLTITTASLLPTAVLNSSYSQQLQASLPDVTWSLVSGNLPPGLTFASGGIISGIPTAIGIFDFTIQAAGGTPRQTTTLSFRLEVTQGVVITTGSTLPAGSTSVPYAAILTATGGSAPYSWILSSGTLPDGLSLTTAGLVSGTPTRAGTFAFVVQATDSANAKATKAFSIAVIAATYSLSLTSVPDTIDPAQQVVVGLSLSSPQPNPISGVLSILFTPTTVISGDDPFVLFSTGSRTVEFTIPANSRTAVFPTSVLLLSGTVSGTIALAADIRNGPAGLSVGTVRVRATVPKFTNVAASRTSAGLRVQVTGYSPDRQVTTAEFGFDVRTPTGIQTVNLVRTVDPDFQNWYRSTGSSPFGSSFVFDQQFTVQGDASMIDSVTVRLTNSQGTASSVPVKFTAN